MPLLAQEQRPGDDRKTAEHTVLVVDDELDVLETLSLFLESYLDGTRVLRASDPHEAIALLEHEPVDAIVSDYRMPEMDGLMFLKRAKELAPDATRIMITAYPALPVATRAVDEAQIHHYLTKPFEPEELLTVLRETLKRQRPEPLDQAWIDRFFEQGGASGATP